MHIGWKGGVELRFADEVVRIPALAIERRRIEVSPGSRNDINRVTITIIAGEVTTSDDAEWVERVTLIHGFPTGDLLARVKEAEAREAEAAQSADG